MTFKNRHPLCITLRNRRPEWWVIPHADLLLKTRMGWVGDWEQVKSRYDVCIYEIIKNKWKIFLKTRNEIFDWNVIKLGALPNLGMFSGKHVSLERFDIIQISTSLIYIQNIFPQEEILWQYSSKFYLLFLSFICVCVEGAQALEIGGKHRTCWTISEPTSHI